MGFVPVEKSNFEAKEVESITRELGKVTINGLLEYAVNPVVISVTVIGWNVALVGTTTLSEVELAAVTVAFTAPK